MTSIAAFISNLAGGGPKDPTATPANAPGAGGIFAALVAATGAAPGAEGEIAAIPELLNPDAATLDGQAVAVAAEGDAALRKALTDGLGLAQEGAEIDAAIIETPDIAIEAAVSTDAALLPVGAQDSKALSATAAAATAAQVNQTQHSGTEQSAVPVSAPHTPVPSADVPAQPGLTPQGHNGTDAARAAGLENALAKASQNGRENGLENAANRSALSSTKGDSFTNAGPNENSLTFKPGTSRSEFAPSGPKIIQQLAKPGSGQTLIKFQPFTGGDTAGATSPPTLTVNVPAHAASPSPAPANVPHVPVSALAVHIAQQARNGAKRFDIRLDPPELGRIEVRLEVSREGQVMTHLVVERAETLDLLQRDARQLERALQDAGLNTSKDDMKFTLKDQNLAQGGNGEGNPDGDTPSSTGAGGDDLPLVPNDAMPPPTRYITSTGLDIRI